MLNIEDHLLEQTINHYFISVRLWVRAPQSLPVLKKTTIYKMRSTSINRGAINPGANCQPSSKFRFGVKLCRQIGVNHMCLTTIIIPGENNRRRTHHPTTWLESWNRRLTTCGSVFAVCAGVSAGLLFRFEYTGLRYLAPIISTSVGPVQMRIEEMSDPRVSKFCMKSCHIAL